MNIRAVALDTGGTVLDWHSRISEVLRAVGERRGLSADWAAVTNEYRRRTMQETVGRRQPALNMDGVHAKVLEPTLQHFGLPTLRADEQAEILAAWHQLDAWPDVVPAMALLRPRWPLVSFTMLPLALVMDVSRRNGMLWDAVISCEMSGIYKPDPETYRITARWLNLEPADILMVVCHNFDLDAARSAGYRSAFVRRPREWGDAWPPDPHPNRANDFVADDLLDLARQLQSHV